MKTNSMKWLSFFLMAILSVGFMACSDDDDDNPIEIPEENSENIQEESDTIKAVDLGLSVKWATRNVGANSPEEYGDYFAWGETEPKDDYDWDTYKWYDDSNDEMTKYNTVDNLLILTSSDDAATSKWGKKWRIPTREEMEELVANCTSTWTSEKGVSGMRYTGMNGNSIFLPAAGSRFRTETHYLGSQALYWSSTLHNGYDIAAYELFFNIYGYIYVWDTNSRYEGLPIRPVTE